VAQGVEALIAHEISIAAQRRMVAIPTVAQAIPRPVHFALVCDVARGHRRARELKVDLRRERRNRALGAGRIARLDGVKPATSAEQHH